MPCNCDELPEIFSLYTKRFSVSLVKIRRDQSDWLKLSQCPNCGQHWQIEPFEKDQISYAIRVDDAANWLSFYDKAIRKNYLLQTRGGVTEETCRMQHCQNNALKGLAYCLDCAYEKLGLRE